MKLTEEQIEALQWLDQMRRKKFGASVFEALQEVVAILQKEQGIQWKPYNLDNLPPVESFQGLILFKSGHVEIATWIVRDKEPGYYWYWPSAYYARQEDITHWAEINLPNQ
jgi:hypothetical protein